MVARVIEGAPCPLPNPQKASQGSGEPVAPRRRGFGGGRASPDIAEPHLCRRAKAL
jgi:hypothetical protein